MSVSTKRRVARQVYRFTAQFVDPIRFAKACRALPVYLRDYFAYRRQEGAEPIGFGDLAPSLHERSGTHEFDAHYFFVNPWAARRILAAGATRHVDVASQTVLSTMLSATLPVTYVDYRPLPARVSGMQTISGDLLQLPLRTASVRSLSCLHVAEHVGLGRYGDPLDPRGTRRAAEELARALAPGGSLFFAVPLGRPRVAFNSHRIHAPETIREYFAALDLREFSGVDDSGRYLENVSLDTFRQSDYACGFYWFVKRAA